MRANNNQPSCLLQHNNQWLAGYTPQNTLTNWDAIEQWQTSATSSDWAIGYITYEGEPLLFTYEQLDTYTLPEPQAPTLEASSSISKPQYVKAIMNLQEHIKAGDIYQANFTYQLVSKFSGNAVNLFSWLYQQQPTPYSLYMKTTDTSILSVSPELLLQQTGSTLHTEPMKGTRPHTDSPDELRDSEKDKAELNMIIDVHRNDLATVSKPGSVAVKEQRRIRELPTVWQADAVIQAELSPYHSGLDALKNMLPAGSISGAPKLRAIKLLQEIETEPRGVYTGAIGYIKGKQEMRFSVAIRTAVIKDDELHYGVGGGIVFDSNAEAEYQESLDKAKMLYSNS